MSITVVDGDSCVCFNDIDPKDSSREIVIGCLKLGPGESLVREKNAGLYG